MKRLAVIALLVIATVSPRAGSTSAYLTSAVSSSGNLFTAGSVTLGLNDNGTAVSTALLTVSNLYPGGTAKYGRLTIQNDGNLSLLYGITSEFVAGSGVANDTIGTSLVNQLELTIVLLATSATTCDATAFAGSPTYVYTTGQLVKTSSVKLVGDAELGSAGGSGNRSLAASGNETFCFRVAMPASATSNLQGASAGVKLTFVAGQAAGR